MTYTYLIRPVPAQDKAVGGAASAEAGDKPKDESGARPCAESDVTGREGERDVKKTKDKPR